jgi:fructoselysine 6-kinase
MRIATVGDNCIDRYLPPIDRALVGGNAVNVAVNLCRAGHQVSYFGAVGDDEDGARASALLARLDIDIRSLRTVAKGHTSVTVIATEPDGNRRFVSEDFGVCRGYRPNDAEMLRLKAMRHVHIGWLDDGGATKRALAEAGISVSQDLSVNAEPHNLSPDSLAVAFSSCDGTTSEALQLMEMTLQQGAGLAVVTRGREGSLASSGGEIWQGMPLAVAIVDTTGAGDSFIAAFLSAYLAQAPVPECLARGHVAAARTCQIFGGFSQD